VEGRLTVKAVPELRREFQRAGRSVRLDLSGLTSADADGVRELLELSARAAKVCGASAYIRQLLDEATG
jgi:ABC-type transporter Mla MlaB component